MATETRQHKFIPVNTTQADGIPCNSHLDSGSDPLANNLTTTLNLPIITDLSRYDVFLWHNPLGKNLPVLEYPIELRSFRPVDINPQSISVAKTLIDQHGPLIPHTREYYGENKLNVIAAKDAESIEFKVPEHQARGFRDDGIFVFNTEQGKVFKFTVCTKGNGTCGYWNERRKTEMLDALDGKIDYYPLNPDGFHARDRRGQARGDKRGDEVVWVGCASDLVTRREVAGSQIYADSNIYHAICLPVKKFDELPLGTGEIIEAQKFTDAFDTEAKLVYLGKAWTLETRIWGNHFTHQKMTSAHLLTAKEGDDYIFQDILKELSVSAPGRRQKLQKESDWVYSLMLSVDNKNWSNILGYAGKVLSQADKNLSLISRQNIIPTILSINMTENVAQAGANRVFGKPVAWHLENVGRLGEVSGGERIYGKATSVPETIEYHSLFAYMFDAYSAVSIEWASSGMDYVSIDEFFLSVKNRILQLNSGHWINSCSNLDQFVDLCQSHLPDYKVSYRSEDAYPLVAVPGTTEEECQTVNSRGTWKNWSKLKNNLEAFKTGIKKAYKNK